MIPYWDFVLGSVVHLLIQLLWERSKDKAELVESQSLGLPGVETDHMIILHATDSSEISDVPCIHEPFVTSID